MDNVRRLQLPDGSTFDLPLPAAAGRFAETTNPVPFTGSPRMWLLPLGIGLAAGALVTWLVLRWRASSSS